MQDVADQRAAGRANCTADEWEDYASRGESQRNHGADRGTTGSSGSKALRGGF